MWTFWNINHLLLSSKHFEVSGPPEKRIVKKFLDKSYTIGKRSIHSNIPLFRDAFNFSNTKYLHLAIILVISFIRLVYTFTESLLKINV